MKKSHQWIEGVEARCPYCGHVYTHFGVSDEGDQLQCIKCKKQFELGEQG